MVYQEIMRSENIKRVSKPCSLKSGAWQRDEMTKIFTNSQIFPLIYLCTVSGER